MQKLKIEISSIENVLRTEAKKLIKEIFIAKMHLSLQEVSDFTF